jgi:hypothetical protein
LFDHFALSTGYQPYEDLTVGAMNHQWYDDRIGHGSPDAFNVGVMLAQKGSSASSGPAQEAEKSDFQVQGQISSGSLGFGTGAGGNFRGIGQTANGTLGKMSGQESG